VWCPSTGMFRVYGRVFCSISLLSVWMCMRMPLSLRSISGVPSSQALPGYLIIARHLCAFLLYLRAVEGEREREQLLFTRSGFFAVPRIERRNFNWSEWRCCARWTMRPMLHGCWRRNAASCSTFSMLTKGALLMQTSSWPFRKYVAFVLNHCVECLGCSGDKQDRTQTWNPKIRANCNRS